MLNMLSFIEKVIIIKHILHAMLIDVLSRLIITKWEVFKLDAIYRNFVWEKNEVEKQ